MKYIQNILAIFVVGFLAFGAFKFKNSQTYDNLKWRIKNAGEGAKEFIAIKKFNVKMQTSPPRQRPLTLIDKESELESWMPELFQPFTEADWKLFWDLIYKPVETKIKGHTSYLYRSPQEVQDVICQIHPKFSFLSPQDWSEIWGITEVSWDYAQPE